VSGDLVFEILGVKRDAPAHQLLGVAPGTQRSELVIAALRNRLELVARAAREKRVDVDLVRVALHDAAGELLSAIERGVVGVQPTSAGSARALQTRNEPKARPSVPEAFEQQARLVLAKYGGWNREAASWIGMLASRHGVSPDEVAATVAKFTGGGAGQHAGTSGTEQAAHSGDRGADPFELRRAARSMVSRPGDQAVFAGIDDEPATKAPSVLMPLLVLMGVVGVGVIVIVVAVMLLMRLGSGSASDEVIAVNENTSVGEAGTAPKAAPEQLFPAPRADSPDRNTTPNKPARPSEWGDVLRELSRASDAAGTDAEAAHARFLDAMDQMAQRWPEAGSDGVLAGVNGVIDYLYRVSARQDLAISLIDAIAASGRLDGDGATPTPESIPRLVWSAGMLARLSREREFGGSVSRRLGDSVAEVLGASLPPNASFQNGAAAALGRLGERLIPVASMDEASTGVVQRGWASWIKCLNAVDPRGGRLHERTVLIALERLMAEGPEPTFSLALADAIRQLTLALPWRSDGEARNALLRWFDAEAVSTPDLNVLTTALATQSGVEGVDLSFALSAKAGWHERAELRDRLSAAWGSAPAISRSELVSQWSTSVRNVLGSSTEGATPTQRLARATRLARLNATCARLWVGEAVGTRDLQADLDSDLEAKVQTVTMQQAAFKIIKPDQSWAGRYAAAGQSITTKRELWGQLSTPLHAVEAEMVAEDAVRGSPSQLRAEAAGVAQRFAADRSMINAMLELVPVMPATNDTTQMIQRLTGQVLPGPREPSWRPEVRRVLVDRLILLIAGTGEQGVVEPLAEVLALSYYASSRAGNTSQPLSPDEAAPATEAATDAGKEKAPLPPDECARMLRARWEQASIAVIPSGREAASAAQLSTRRAARTGLASGPIQRFHAEQVGIAELMAYVVANEQPSRAVQAGAIIDAAHDKRRRANHILEQIEIVEVAISRLWLLRFGEVMP